VYVRGNKYGGGQSFKRTGDDNDDYSCHERARDNRLENVTR